jgi:Flp pilus assembly pilin Flp
MFSFSSRSKREQGHGLFKYVMILALMAVIIVGTMKVLGPAIGDTFSTVNASLGNDSGGGHMVITGSFQADDLYWNNPANGCTKGYSYGTNPGCDQIADRVQACLAGAIGSYCDDYFAVAPR